MIRMPARQLLSLFGICALVAALLLAGPQSGARPGRAAPSIFTVNSTLDGADAAINGVCQTATVGQCTLRAAIQEANANPGSQINFAIGSGLQTIAPGSALPTITGQVVIDARTQPGHVSAPLIEIDGTSAGGAASGFTVNVSGSFASIYGFVINSFGGGAGIDVLAGTAIAGNDWVGLQPDGSTIAGNGVGVRVQSGADAGLGSLATGLANVISGNGTGVELKAGSLTTTTFIGNFIGTDASGTLDRGNTNYGIDTAIGATIGSTNPRWRNVISGNGTGIRSTAASGLSVLYNSIGTDMGGTVNIGNTNAGVDITGTSSSTIGTTEAPNTIAYNGGAGVKVTTATGVSIRGNAIFGNGGGGIDLIGAANGSIAAPVITGIAPVAGTACASCTVDVYSDAGSQGARHHAVVTADGSGNWAYYGEAGSPNVTATATNAGGNTSEFGSFARAACSAVCLEGFWHIDYTVTSGPTSLYCTVYTNQTGATVVWGHQSCTSGIEWNFTGSVNQGASTTTITSTSVVGGLVTTATGTFNGAGTTAAGTWTCTAVCGSSGTWTGVKLNNVASIPAGGGILSLTGSVPAVTVTIPSGSPAVSVTAMPYYGSSGGLVRTAYDFEPSGLTLSSPAVMTVTLNATTDLPPAPDNDCLKLAHYVQDPDTGLSTFAGRVACSPSGAQMRVELNSFSVHRFEVGRDTDGDGIDDGPDVCPLVSDVGQQHDDAHLTYMSDRGYKWDYTWPMGDDTGDACETDGDKDNDGLSDTQEGSGSACAGRATDPAKRDSDGDRVLDRAECLIPGRDPNVIEATPPSPLLVFPSAGCAAPGGSTQQDLDGDGLPAYLENCYYGTNPSNPNSDGAGAIPGAFHITPDTCSDGQEVYNITADFAVASTDLSQYAIAWTHLGLTTPETRLNFDVNKDGALSATDLSLIAQHFSASGCQSFPAPP